MYASGWAGENVARNRGSTRLPLKMLHEPSLKGSFLVVHSSFAEQDFLSMLWESSPVVLLV